MSYANLMVHLALDRDNTALLTIVGGLAEQCHAGVVGIAACQPTPLLYPGAYAAADLQDRERALVDAELQRVETAFRRALEPRGLRLEWRASASFNPLLPYILQQSRSADMVILEVSAASTLRESGQVIDLHDLILHLGRPVLLVPEAASAPKLKRVFIGWRNTHDARRAIYDALPLLRQAETVVIIEVGPEEEIVAAREGLADVAAWLRLHGVNNVTEMAVTGSAEAAAMLDIAAEQGADLIVAGAYSHHPLLEWLRAGAMRDLLLRGQLCVLISH